MPRSASIALVLFVVLSFVLVITAFAGVDPKVRLALDVMQLACLAVYVSWWWRHRRRQGSP